MHCRSFAQAIASTSVMTLAQSTAFPGKTEGDYLVRDFRFRNSEILPELRLHFQPATVAFDFYFPDSPADLIRHALMYRDEQFMFDAGMVPIAYHCVLNRSEGCSHRSATASCWARGEAGSTRTVM